MLLQAKRREQAGALLAELEGLWGVLDISGQDVDRSLLSSALTNPAPVHRHTLEEVRSPPCAAAARAAGRQAHAWATRLRMHCLCGWEVWI